MSAHRPTRRKDGFSCVHCRAHVPLASWGTDNRNHCPACLWSRHVDDVIGDRRSACNQPMEPIAVAARADGEWAIIHKCAGCGQLRTNRIAGDDDEVVLLALALRPISAPAFPIDSIRR
jgi:hypothetical protein